DIGDEATRRFLPDEEARELRLRDLEDQIEVLANELVVFGHLVADRAKRASSRHPVAFLQPDLRLEPLLEIAPRGDLVVQGTAAFPNRVEMGQQHFVNQAFLVSKVVIELSLSCP